LKSRVCASKDQYYTAAFGIDTFATLASCTAVIGVAESRGMAKSGLSGTNQEGSDRQG